MVRALDRGGEQNEEEERGARRINCDGSWELKQRHLVGVPRVRRLKEAEEECPSRQARRQSRQKQNKREGEMRREAKQSKMSEEPRGAQTIGAILRRGSRAGSHRERNREIAKEDVGMLEMLSALEQSDDVA